MLFHNDVDHVIIHFPLGRVCVQVDVSVVMFFTRYGGHNYGHFFPVSGWVSSRVFCVLFLFSYDLLGIAVFVIDFY